MILETAIRKYIKKRSTGAAPLYFIAANGDMVSYPEKVKVQEHRANKVTVQERLEEMKRLYPHLFRHQDKS